MPLYNHAHSHFFLQSPVVEQTATIWPMPFWNYKMGVLGEEM